MEEIYLINHNEDVLKEKPIKYMLVIQAGEDQMIADTLLANRRKVRAPQGRMVANGDWRRL